MANRAGQWPAPSNTVRPAEKGTKPEGLDPALMRRLIDAECALADSMGRPIRRKEAHARVLRRIAGTPDVLRGARNGRGILDPTGETAARNADRERGGDR